MGKGAGGQVVEVRAPLLAVMLWGLTATITSSHINLADAEIVMVRPHNIAANSRGGEQIRK